MSRGCLIGRSLRYAIGIPVATATVLKALLASDPRRADGCITVIQADSTAWIFDADATAVAGPTVYVPDSGSGRWLALGGAGVGAGAPKVLSVRGASTANIANLAVFTVAGVDGLTYVEGERILLKNQTNKAQNGPYRCGAVAGGTCALTRVGEADASAEVVAGMLVYVSEGTAAGNEWFFLSTNDTIVLGTTDLDFLQVPSLVDLASVASGEGAALIGVQDAAGRFAGANSEVVLTDLGARIALAFANTAAQTAYSATARADRQIAIVDDDDAGAQADGSLWLFDAASVAGASNYVRVPDAGTGRWLRLIPTLAEMAATTVGLGGDMSGLYDATAVVTATTVGAGIVEVATDLNTHRPGMPMTNRLRMLGAPGAIVEGNTVTIGANVFEFRASTPPAGGTAGRIWLYQGADSAASRAAFIDAINGVVDAARITYDGALTITFLATAGVTLGDVIIRSAATAGGAVVPSAVATAVAETLATGTDVWDQATCYGGFAQAHTQSVATTVTLTADMIAKANLQVQFGFTPTHCVLVNRMRPQNEAVTIVGNAVNLVLAGGATPNNQAADVIDVIAFG